MAKRIQPTFIDLINTKMKTLPLGEIRGGLANPELRPHRGANSDNLKLF